jgi:hypothetical protein
MRDIPSFTRTFRKVKPAKRGNINGSSSCDSSSSGLSAGRSFEHFPTVDQKVPYVSDGSSVPSKITIGSTSQFINVKKNLSHYLGK